VWPPLELTSDLQRAHDPEYAFIMDTQLKPKGKGRILGASGKSEKNLFAFAGLLS